MALKIAIGQPFEIANKIGSPIPASDHPHDDWLFHNTVTKISTFYFTTAPCLAFR